MSKTTADIRKNVENTAIKPITPANSSANLPTSYDYGEYAGAGFESHTKDDYATPFLGVLQTNSPLCENNAEARPGMIFNTVTNEFFDGKKGIIFIPAYTQHTFVEWTPRDQGGGFVAVHPLDSEIVKKAKEHQEFGKYKMGMTLSKNAEGKQTATVDPKSNDLIETFYIYGVLVKEDGSSEQMIIAFTSTKNKIYKQWMMKARTVQIALPDGRRIIAPLFAHKYRVTTVGQKNAKGSFYNFQVNFDGKDAAEARLAPTDPLFLQAVSFVELIKANDVKVAYDSQTASADDTETTETPFK